MKTFKLPDLGEGLPDAEIVNWLVKEGDTIEIDQPMVEMETAKAVVEVPSPFKGVVSKLHGKTGDVIFTGAPLIDIDDGSGTSTAPVTTPIQQPAKTADITNTTTSTTAAAAQIFKLPDLGEGLPDAEIVNWLIKEGDIVKIDQPMVEMETAKAVVEVPCPQNGVIGTLHGQPGDVIKTGAPLVTFAGTLSGLESAPETQAAEPTKSDAATVVGAVEVGNTITTESVSAIAGSNLKATPVIKALARKLKVDLSQIQPTGADNSITQADVRAAASQGQTKTDIVAQKPATSSGTSNPLNFKASPAVRALAGRLGVDLAYCQASGKKGSITRDDVKNATHKPSAVSNIQQSTISATTVSNQGTQSRLPSIQVTPKAIRGARRAMAAAMSLSHSCVVPVTLMDDVDISSWPKGTDATARMLRAIAYASRIVPELNGWFDGENMEVLHHPEVHVGVAVDTPAGLYVPVIKNAESRTGADLRAELNDKMERITHKAIKPDELTGATISLSNYGTIAGRYGTPVVVPPQIAILGTGRYRDELKLTDTGIGKARMLPLSLSFDHRACTGGEGARFLAALMVDLKLAK